MLLTTRSYHIIFDALGNLAPFVQFKKREKQPRRVVSLRLHSSLDVFHDFQIVQMVPTCAKPLVCLIKTK